MSGTDAGARVIGGAIAVSHARLEVLAISQRICYMHTAYEPSEILREISGYETGQ